MKRLPDGPPGHLVRWAMPRLRPLWMDGSSSAAAVLCMDVLDAAMRPCKRPLRDSLVLKEPFDNASIAQGCWTYILRRALGLGDKSRQALLSCIPAWRRQACGHGGPDLADIDDGQWLVFLPEQK